MRGKRRIATENLDRRLLNRAANLREHIVGIRTDESNRAHDDH